MVDVRPGGGLCCVVDVGIIRGFAGGSSLRLRERSTSMQSTPNPSKVRFTGPLAPFAAGLVDEFARLGYPASTATAKM